LGRERFLSSGALARKESAEAAYPGHRSIGVVCLPTGGGSRLSGGMVSSTPDLECDRARVCLVAGVCLAGQGARSEDWEPWWGKPCTTRLWTKMAGRVVPRGWTIENMSLRRGVGSGLVGGLGGREWIHCPFYGLSGICRITPSRYGHACRRSRGEATLVAGRRPPGEQPVRAAGCVLARLDAGAETALPAAAGRGKRLTPGAGRCLSPRRLT